MDYKTFKEDEFPYKTLEKYGLTQEMIEDLPTAALEDLKSGRRSPVLPISVTDEDGNVIHSRTRLKFQRQEDGSVDVLFYPQLKICKLDQYSKEEQDALLIGKAIISRAPEDEKLKCFVQIDRETNNVMYIPTPVIGRNLRSLMDSFHLTSAEIQVIQGGDPMTFMEGEELVTAGIDLNEKTGIRMMVGDLEKWNRGRSDAYERYNFGIFGCWVKDDQGNLDYIHEDDYTEEIWNEQKKVVERNSGLKR